MAVYVDDMRCPVGRLILCHMVGDSEPELHAMADRIGLPRRYWDGDHYDICLAKRKLAVKAGAIEITKRQAARLLRIERRANG